MAQQELETTDLVGPSAFPTPQAQPDLWKASTATEAAPAPEPPVVARRPFGRLRLNTVVLTCSDDEMQLGLDERWALRICGLQPAECAWLLDVANRRHIPAITSARRLRLDPQRLAELVAVLDRAGYWQRERPQKSRTLLRAPGDGTGDLATLGLLRADNLGRATLDRRARATVAITDSGRLGAAIARHLATAGVGRLIVPDNRPVQLADLGLGGYQRNQIGAGRFNCLVPQLRRCSSTTALHDGEPDMVVAIEQDAVSTGTWTALMGEAVPHLFVVAGEADLSVGPFVLPGRTGCANCWHLHRKDADPSWPELARQLAKMPQRPVETTLAAMGAALAAGQVLATIDGRRPVTEESLLRVALPQVIPELSPAPSHPDCACRNLRRDSEQVPGRGF